MIGTKVIAIVDITREMLGLHRNRSAIEVKKGSIGEIENFYNAHTVTEVYIDRHMLRDGLVMFSFGWWINPEWVELVKEGPEPQTVIGQNGNSVYEYQI